MISSGQKEQDFLQVMNIEWPSEFGFQKVLKSFRTQKKTINAGDLVAYYLFYSYNNEITKVLLVLWRKEFKNTGETYKRCSGWAADGPRGLFVSISKPTLKQNMR